VACTSAVTTVVCSLLRSVCASLVMLTLTLCVLLCVVCGVYAGARERRQSSCCVQDYAERSSCYQTTGMCSLYIVHAHTLIHTCKDVVTNSKLYCYSLHNVCLWSKQLAVLCDCRADVTQCLAIMNSLQSSLKSDLV
jgi:hypothetical protein